MAEDKESSDLKESPDPVWADQLGPDGQPAATEEGEKEAPAPSEQGSSTP